MLQVVYSSPAPYSEIHQPMVVHNPNGVEPFITAGETGGPPQPRDGSPNPNTSPPVHHHALLRSAGDRDGSRGLQIGRPGGALGETRYYIYEGGRMW